MRRSAALLPVLLTVALLQAQDRPTFRGGANYVRVDLYATRDGVPVTDLRPEEIAVLEDGEPQTVEDFELVRVQPRGTEVARSEPESVEQSRQLAADPRARLFVVFLDTYHTRVESLGRLRDSFGGFLDRLIGPDDLVALMTPEMAASDIAFSRKTTVIARILQEEWWGRRNRAFSLDPQEEEWLQCYRFQDDNPVVAEMIARRRERIVLDALDDLIGHLDGIRDERKMVLTVTEGWRLFEPESDFEPQAVREPQPFGPPGFEPVVPRQPAVRNQACETARMALSQIDSPFRLAEITRRARRDNVTFYPIDARGLAVYDSQIGDGPPPSQLPRDTSTFTIDDRRALSVFYDSRTLRLRQDALRDLADQTGGIAVVNTNSLEPAMARIVESLSSFYLLGYYSTNPELDGRYRTIEVKVSRRDVDVRHRRGYLGRTAEEVAGAGARDPATRLRVLARAFESVERAAGGSALRVRAAPWVRVAPGREPAGQFWVVGELDYRTWREPEWRAGATASVVIRADDGREVMAAALDAPAGGGSFLVRVPESGRLDVGVYTVLTSVRSATGGALALSDTTQVPMEAASPLGEPLLWRSGPSTGREYRRTADPRFQRSERLRLELPSTDPAPAHARLLDRRGALLPVPVTIARRPGAEAALTWIVADLSLAPLAPGDYAVEVAQGDAWQIVGFRIDG